MPRGKKTGRAAKAARFRAATAPQPRNRNENLASSFLPRAARTHGQHGQHGFTLADEARNTAHRTPWDASARLRSRPVVFVSAGLIEPLKDLHLDDKNDGNTEAQDGHPGKREEDKPFVRLDHASEPQLPAVQESSRSEPYLSPPEEHIPFFIDTTGDQKLSGGALQPLDIPGRPSSGNATDSSEEVILFKGRSGARKDESPVVVLDEIMIEVKTTEHIEENAEGIIHTGDQPSPHVKYWETREEEEAAIVADYIANMATNDDEDEEEDDEDGAAQYRPFFGSRDLGGTDNELVVDEESNSDAALSAHDVGDIDCDSPDEDADDDDMNDEDLARMLAKQEELGLDDDELAIFSAEFLSATAGSSHVHPQRKAILSESSSRSRKTRGLVPSASAVADAFDELDLMDWDRHNPPRKPKSKRGLPTFDLSDSELEATLQNSYQKDRLRKSDRKKEREELRAQGLLGKNRDPNDPRVKYQEGMTLDQIKEELRDFLIGSDPSLTLPPMDASARKIVHELANKFKIKSKSAGKADQRRPALYRTQNTVPYAEHHFEQVFTRSGRKYFPRLDVKFKGAKKPTGTGRINHAAFSYRDGEVVGASAPELAQSNKGRTMLEKMGWSTGMGLGSVDNKGILQPVAHVVKRSKAGLG